ncbi:MAG: hypothetical protein AAF513_17980 [Pseudomonadota bacterium]
MQLVEDYLYEVSRYLPEDSRADILAELRDAIEEEVQARAADAPGDEVALQEAVLTGYGHPVQIASRYHPQQSLIGPELYPMFKRTLGFLLILALVVQFIVMLILGYTETVRLGPLAFFWTTIETLVWVTAIVLGIFFLMQYSSEEFDWYDNWSVKSLASNTRAVVNRSDVLTNLITEGVFLLWWNGTIFLPDIYDALPLAAAPVWEAFYWHLNVVVGLAFALHTYTLLRGVWQRQTLVLELAVNAAFLGVCAAILLSGTLLLFADSVSTWVAQSVNRTLRIVILVLMGFTIWDMWIALKNLRGQLNEGVVASA